MILAKRVYEPPSPEDGQRILIDRLWPRGLTKARAKVDRWVPDLAPSSELRTWFQHDPAKYPQFRERYRMELARHPDALAEIALAAEKGPVTLVFAARDATHCNASVLKQLLEEVAEDDPRPRRPRRGSPGGRIRLPPPETRTRHRE